MAATLRFNWVNGGEPFVLPDIPMIGDDELDRLTSRYARTIVLQKQSYLLQRMLAILSVKRVLDMGKPEVAHRAWLQALPMVEPPQSRSLYEWSVEDFPQEFESYFNIEIEQKYSVNGYDEAHEFLQQKANDLEKQMSDSDPLQVKEFQKERLVTDLYWRLKRQFPTIDVDGEEVPISKESLRKVILIPGDWNSYNEALKDSQESGLSPEEERERHLEEVDIEDIKKKSRTTLKSDKPSKIDSPSTSEPGTATGSP